METIWKSYLSVLCCIHFKYFPWVVCIDRIVCEFMKNV